jgi:hypothetical protein
MTSGHQLFYFACIFPIQRWSLAVELGLEVVPLMGVSFATCDSNSTETPN